MFSHKFLHSKLVELHIKPGISITSISNFDFWKRNFHLLLSSSSDINECASNPCQNGGTCVDAVNGYNCSCVSGWAGEHCTTGSKTDLYVLKIIDVMLFFNWLDEQVSVTQNLAACGTYGTGISMTSISNYNCKIRNFLLLSSSSSDIKECASNPCQNGGTCVDAVNGYNCSCVSGWTGEHCTTGSRTNLYVLTIINITLYTTGWMTTNSWIDPKHVELHIKPGIILTSISNFDI